MKHDSPEIRVAVPEDAEALLSIYQPYILHTAVTYEKEVPSVKEFRRRMDEVLAKYPYLVALWEGEIVGYSYAHRFRERAAFDWAVEVSLYVKDDCRGRGIGSLLYRRLEEALAAQGITNCYAFVAAPIGEDPYLTMDSPLFHQHMGYRKVGILHKSGYKFGRWYDMLIMEKFVGDHREVMNLVVPFTEEKHLGREDGNELSV